MADSVITAGIRINADVQGAGQIEHLSKETQKLSQNGQQLNTQLNPITASLRQMGQKSHSASKGLMDLGQSAMKLGAAYLSVDALRGAIGSVLEKTQEYQALQTKFSYAFDGAEEGAKQLAFVREEANRLGLEFESAANGYAQLASATKDLNITQEQTQDIFKGVMSATAAMSLSADEANGVFLALSQIAGKGKVSMEELRGQLGERLTPAMSIAATAMGVTTSELEKMVENGLAAETFLPKFGAALEEAFGAEAATNVQSLSGQINLLKNSFNEFLVQLGENGIGKGVVAVMQDIGAALDFAKAQFDAFSQSENGKLLEQNFSQFYELIKEIGSTLVNVFHIAKDTVGDFASTLSSAFSGSQQEIDLLQAVLNGVNLTLGAMRDGVEAVNIAFNLFAGAAKDLLGFIADGMSRLTFGDWASGLEKMAADLRQSAEQNYETANQAALNFESHTARVWQNMAEQANQAKSQADQANAALAQTASEASQTAAKTDELSQAYKNAQTAVSSFGLDMRAAMNEATPAMVEMHGNLGKLVAGFDDLQANGVNAADLIGQAIAKMTESAKNQADIDLLKQSIQDLGDTGKMSMQDVERAILATDTRLQELKGTIDPTEAAFKKLGIQSRESLRLAAEETRLAFETVKNSGQATAADLQAAFERTASALLATGDSNQQAWVESEASAYNYKVVIDETGKAALQSAAQTQAASKQKIAAYQQEAAAASAAASAAKSASDAQVKGQTEAKDSTEKTTEAVENQTKKVITLAEEMDTVFKLYTGGGTAAYMRAYQMGIALFDKTNAEIRKVNQSLKDGTDLAKSLADAEFMAASYADKLGDKTLKRLRTAIEDARNKMKEFAEEAANARYEAEKELLSAQGRDEEIAELEQKRKIDELRKKQDAMKKLGNQAASSDYEKAIEASNKAFEERKRRETEQREQERLEAEQREREKAEQQRQREQEKAEQQRQRELEKAEQQRQHEQLNAQQQHLKNAVNQPVNVDVNVDFDGLISALQQNAANTAVQQVFSNLQEAAFRSR